MADVRAHLALVRATREWLAPSAGTREYPTRSPVSERRAPSSQNVKEARVIAGLRVEAARSTGDWCRAPEPFTAPALVNGARPFDPEELRDEMQLQLELLALEKQAIALRREAEGLRPSRWVRLLRWLGRLLGAGEQ